MRWRTHAVTVLCQLVCCCTETRFSCFALASCAALVVNPFLIRCFMEKKCTLKTELRDFPLCIADPLGKYLAQFTEPLKTI